MKSFRVVPGFLAHNKSHIEISQGSCHFDVDLWLIMCVSERQQSLDAPEIFWAWSYTQKQMTAFSQALEVACTTLNS